MRNEVTGSLGLIAPDEIRSIKTREREGKDHEREQVCDGEDSGGDALRSVNHRFLSRSEEIRARDSLTSGTPKASGEKRGNGEQRLQGPFPRIRVFRG